MGLQRNLYSAWAWLGIAGVTIGGVGYTLPAYLGEARTSQTRAKTGRRLRDLAIAAARINPMWRFEVYGNPPPPPEGGAVYVSNHVSQADIFLISHLPWEMKWLAKTELFTTPFLGWQMRMAGDVEVKRGQKDSAREAMQQCANYLKQGMSVMIFPEGTRSRDGSLQPFKDGAFRLAIDTQKPIIPLAVAGTREALPKHSWQFGEARALVAVGDPIDTAGMTLDDVDRLRDAARTSIASLLETIQPLCSGAAPAQQT